MTVKTNIDKGIQEAIKKQTASQKAAKKAKIASKTNFDNTYADIIFPFVFDENKQGTTVANTGSLEKASKTESIKVKRYLIKRGKIDSTAGLVLNANGTPKGDHSGFGACKPIKVSFGSVLKTRKKTTGAKGQKLSAKYYSREWYVISVPKSATVTDIFMWITKNWKFLPDVFQMGEQIYNVKPKKQAYNNPTPAQTAKSARGRG